MGHPKHDYRAQALGLNGSLALPTCAALVVLAVGCGENGKSSPPTVSPDPSPPTARWSQVEEFRADLEAPRHVSDGQGTARIVEGPASIIAGSLGRWTVEFEVAETGISTGGVLTFFPEPFWGWSTPQTRRPDLPGFTEVRCDVPGVTLDAATFGQAEAGMLVLTVEEGTLSGGDRITLVYGAGPGARADRYAGRGARLWIGVDGDGDGVRALVADSPSVDVNAGAPERLVLRGPSIVRPGAMARFHVSLIDGWASAAPAPIPSGTHAVLDALPDGWAGPTRVELDERGFAAFELTVGSGAESNSRASSGLATGDAIRLGASVDFGEGTVVRTRANPLVIHPTCAPIFWADLHGHSGRSDGTGAVEDYFRYARDTARLDVVSLTDHDHFGPRFLDAAPEWWDEIRAATSGFHRPGEFVTVLGYEWTSWIHGHRHVLHFAEDGPLLSSLDERYDDPAKLWEALRGSPSITMAHHSSGNPIPQNWSYAPDPVLEPVTEVVSVHGSSEARDAPRVVAGSRDGWFVRDQLDRGVRLGFVGSGDSHDGHPGLAHLSPAYGWRAAAPAAAGPGRPGTGGVAALMVRDLSRDSVLAALRTRRTYATSGPRIVATASPLEDGSRLRLVVHGTARIAGVDLILGPADPGGEAEVQSLALGPGEANLDIDLELDISAAAGRPYHYLRIVQVDRGTAWLGPWFRAPR